MEGLVEEFMAGARDEMAVVAEKGGAVEAVPYMKARLVESHRERFARIENGEQTVVGLNKYTETEDSPLTASADGGIMKPDPQVEKERIEALEAWRSERDQAAVDAALAEVARVAGADDENIMPATIAAAKAGATTGEWAATLREVFGAYRGPTGVGGAAPAGDRDSLTATREKVNEVSGQIGHRIRLLVGKPGLDGHSNGSEQIALRARDVGMEVVYQGIRLTPEQIVESAVQEDVDLIGLSILSGSHLELIPEVVRLLQEEGVEVPVVAGGIIPPEDAARLKEAGVAGVFTPKDFDMNEIMGEFVDLVAANHEKSAAATA
jgi:(2R)-ethylmalonyl-CoA mutase